jgi:hypothetical protein
MINRQRLHSAMHILKIESNHISQVAQLRDRQRNRTSTTDFSPLCYLYTKRIYSLALPSMNI